MNAHSCAVMGVVNLTPDSFVASTRACGTQIRSKMLELLDGGADIIDIGAVSSRPGAACVEEEEEWRRLRPALLAAEELWKEGRMFELSIDTTRSGIVRRSADAVGEFIVNDISAGEDDPGMLAAVVERGLRYVAMHKRGTPVTMDGRCLYPGGVVNELLEYFRDFGQKALAAGLRDWIVDPGLGFAKTPEQCVGILENLNRLKALGHKILIGAADKRFTVLLGGTAAANRLAFDNGADILRVHSLPVF